MIDLETLMPICKEVPTGYRINIFGVQDASTGNTYKLEPLHQVYNSRPEAETARQKIFDAIKAWWFGDHRQELELDNFYTQLDLQLKEI